jgi:hypothetical protein
MTSGAKALMFSGGNGTTEVVPLPRDAVGGSFSARMKSCPSVHFYGRLGGDSEN